MQDGFVGVAARSPQVRVADVDFNVDACLHEATDALEDFFYLDSQTTGQQGTIRLRVSLDGETQGNSYQNACKRRYAVDYAKHQHYLFCGVPKSPKYSDLPAALPDHKGHKQSFNDKSNDKKDRRHIK